MLVDAKRLYVGIQLVQFVAWLIQFKHGDVHKEHCAFQNKNQFTNENLFYSHSHSILEDMFQSMYYL